MTKNFNATLMLVVLYGAAFVAAFSENIINVALLDITAEMGVDTITAQWLVTGYMIVGSIMVAATSFLFRRFTLRQLFFAAAGVFLVGLAGAYFAPMFPLLLTFRLIQALGTGMFITLMMNTVLIIAPRAKLGTYLAIGSCCITLGPAFGPVVSGAMVVALGWRAIFIPPFVVMVILAVAGVALLHNVAETADLRLDILSLVLLAAGLTLVVFGLTQIMSAPVLGVVVLVVGVAIIVVFGWRQLRIEQPMMNVRPLFKGRFSVACVLSVVAMMTTFSMSVLMPLYFQGALEFSALASGALILIPIVINAVFSLFGGRIMDARGEWPLIPCGFALIVIGQACICAVSPSMNLVAVVAAACVVYAGVGLIFSPSQTAGLKSLTPEENPHGVGMMNTFIQVAGALGPSLFVGVYSNTAASAVLEGSTAAYSQAQGFSSAVLVAAVIAAVALVVAIFYAKSAGKQPVAAAARKRVEESAGQIGAQPISGDVAAFTARDLMRADAYCIPANATVRDAMTAMNERRTSGLPVVDRAGKVVGFISTGDVIQALGDKDTAAESLSFMYRVAYEQPEFKERLETVMAANVMDYATDRVVTVAPEATVGEVCAVLGRHSIKKVPVVAHGKLVGMISRADVARRVMVDLV